VANEMNIINYIEAGLRAEGLRQKAIANNVANMNTPGFRRTDLRFEELLAKAIESNGRIDVSEIKPEFYQPKNTPLKANGNDVSLDSEVGAMVKNSLRHKTFMMLLKKKYSQFQAAINVR
jgi:flagellar basal-body rod protein FlgB